MRTAGGIRVAETEEHSLDEAMPGLAVTPRRLVLFGVFVVLAVGFLYLGLPRIAGLEQTWARMDDGNPWWLAAAFAFSVLAFGGYVLLFRGVFGSEETRIGFRASYQIAMAGFAASRVFAAGGAGGLVLTAWALRRAGMPGRRVADLTVAFLALTYVVFMAALIVVGLGLYFGVLGGPAPFAITVLPACLGAFVILVALGLSVVPPDLARRFERRDERVGRLARLGGQLANLPASSSAGVREAMRHVRTGDPSILGSLIFWGCNIGILWASFRAFGQAPAGAVIVMGFFVGMLGNLLPLPAGVGGVDGATIGAFVALGVSVDLAIVAVLTYRIFAFWLPILPGVMAWLQLRRTVARWRAERRAEVPAPGPILSEA